MSPPCADAASSRSSDGRGQPNSILAIVTLHIVGLGPAGSDLVTARTLALLESAGRVVVRTRHHPAVPELDPSSAWLDCDDLYQQASAFPDVYEAVVRRVLEATDGVETAVYAVPGSPLIAESTVPPLLAAAAATGLATRVHAAVSFVDAAAAALGIDLGTAQICDALALRIDPQRPALIAQVFSRDTATALKLDLLDLYPPLHRVVLLQGLAGANETVRERGLAEIDREAVDHLTTLYLPALAAEHDVRRFDGLKAIVDRLHAPDGCPWDREQTHGSLRPHLLEESYEALEAIDAGDPAALTEELGDVLLQVLMHAAVAEREGEFGFSDVSEHIARKLVRRHPHVFGDVEADSAEAVYRNWDQLKRAEKPRESILDGVPLSMPALAASQSIQGRARRAGFDWPDIEGPLAKLQEEIAEFARADDGPAREDEFGDILFVLANIGQRLGIDAEQALRGANQKFRRRFGAVERLAAERGLELAELNLAGLDALWDEVKLGEGRRLR